MDEVRVVLGHRAAEIEENLAAEGVTTIRNPRYLEGMLTSVQEGMVSAPTDTEWFVIALGDQPSLRAETVARLLRTAREEAADGGNERPTIVVPSYGGRRGHPLLISAAHREEIGALPEEGGLRELLRRHPEAIQHVTLDDERVLEDMDTPEEYQRQVERLRGEV